MAAARGAPGPTSAPAFAADAPVLLAAPGPAAVAPAPPASMPAVAPPLVAPPPIFMLPATTIDDDRIAGARAMRAGGIALFSVGVPLTVFSQLLVAMSIIRSIDFVALDGQPPSGRQAQLDAEAQPYRVAAIATVIVGNLMIASGLALWGTANSRLRGRSRPMSVGALDLAPSSDGHGGQAGLLIHF